VRFYHNPRCSKSRQALALLEQQGCLPDVIRYLEEGVQAEDANAIAVHANSVRRKDLPEGANGDVSTVEGRAELILAHPRCMERPVLVHNGVAVIGRPPEDVLTLLE
jgi:arsenate reductase